ncbi:MAG: DUF3795 domain-containing protein [Bacillota bacterium]
MATSREILAYCGLNCSDCPAYIATQNNDQEGLKQTAEKWSKELKCDIRPEDCVCDGCLPFEGARLGGYCGECPVRACGIKKSYPNCAYCPDYPCENLAKFQVGATEAKERLDSLRRQICNK